MRTRRPLVQATRGRFISPLVACLGFLALFTLTGCCGGKVQECNKLISVINSNGESIKAATAKMNASKDDPKAIEEVANTMDKAADEIKKAELDDDELQGHAKQYEDMLRNGAKAARDMVKASNDNNVADLKKAMEEISKVEKTEQDLVNKVNAYCTQ